MRCLFIVILCLLFTSCSILLNKSHTDVYVYSHQPVTVTYDKESMQVDSTNRMHIYTRRSNKPLNISVSNDSINKDIYLSSKISPVFVANLFYFPIIFLDLLSNKRYEYEKEIILNDRLILDKHAGSAQERKSRKQLKKRLNAKYNALNLPEKGGFYMNLSFPFALPSQTYLNPKPGLTTSRGSFLGFGLGFDYYYKKDRFFNLSSSAVFGGDLQIGCGDWGYDDETLFNIYNISFSHNHRYNRFTFGYGLSYVYNDWWKNEYKPESLKDERGYALDDRFPPGRHYEAWRYSTLGLTLNTYYLFTRSFNVGITYRPQIFRLSSDMPSRFRYEHQISLDIAFKVSLFTRKKN